MNFIFNDFFLIGSSGADELKIGPLLFCAVQKHCSRTYVDPSFHTWTLSGSLVHDLAG
jgi:hypothetical protein